jgi:predicted DNA-binding protein (UPF0278 family)
MEKCRRRIEKNLKAGGKDVRAAVGIALSILKGETDQEHVNTIIDEFDLTEELGITKS